MLTSVGQVGGGSNVAPPCTDHTLIRRICQDKTRKPPTCRPQFLDLRTKGSEEWQVGRSLGSINAARCLSRLTWWLTNSTQVAANLPYTSITLCNAENGLKEE